MHQFLTLLEQRRYSSIIAALLCYTELVRGILQNPRIINATQTSKELCCLPLKILGRTIGKFVNEEGK
ncbi:MAG: hypothetical protein Q7S89_02935, partial [bacterium]|nr:hypothetical protein [bacterium]